MKFRYLRDPLFQFCIVVYFVNRWVLKHVWDSSFFHSYLNDLICIPFWVPIMLYAERKVGLRDTDGPPEAHEILIPLVLWSWVFEIVLPANPFFARYSVADHRDVMCYSLGAFLAAVFWRWRYRNPPTEKRDTVAVEFATATEHPHGTFAYGPPRRAVGQETRPDEPVQ
jgi:hypothetical protein